MARRRTAGARRRGAALPWAIAASAIVVVAASSGSAHEGAAIPNAAFRSAEPDNSASAGAAPPPGLAPQRVEPVEPASLRRVRSSSSRAIRQVMVERVHDEGGPPGCRAKSARQKVALRQLRRRAQSRPPTPVWPVRAIDGASGRLVRIGAFTTVHQAKRGWWAIVRSTRRSQHLPARSCRSDAFAMAGSITACRWARPRRRIPPCCASGCRRSLKLRRHRSPWRRRRRACERRTLLLRRPAVAAAGRGRGGTARRVGAQDACGARLVVLPRR